MSNLLHPENYRPVLNRKQTEQGIKLIKDFFQQNLATELRLSRVTLIRQNEMYCFCKTKCDYSLQNEMY